jgi:hypothetical protein
VVPAGGKIGRFAQRWRRAAALVGRQTGDCRYFGGAALFEGRGI